MKSYGVFGTYFVYIISQARKKDLLEAIDGHVLQHGCITGGEVIALYIKYGILESHCILQSLMLLSYQSIFSYLVIHQEYESIRHLAFLSEF